jgi:UDP-N-acetylglucosamine 2-epimerase (non-hydrolysing)
MSMRVLSVFGTRPEAIKMAPVVRALEERPGFISRVCVTGQHRQMLDQVLEIFSIKPHHDLSLMQAGQDLNGLTARILGGVKDVLRQDRPDLVIVQGDTTTCMATALAAFYERIPIAHVEAGLRSGRLDAPFPEEANRCIVSRIADLHFAPTVQARDNLIKEGIQARQIAVTGNTVIDALLLTRERVQKHPTHHWVRQFGPALCDALEGHKDKIILVTGHRRENFGQGMEDLCAAIRDLAVTHRNWLFIYPVHLNPRVQEPVQAILSGFSNVHLIEPLDYLSFVWLMNRSDLILTDSGGIQEEAPSLGKPVLVMRDVTERVEAVEAGTVRLVGTNRAVIRYEVERLLTKPELYQAMASIANPYGRGNAATEIVDVIERWAVDGSLSEAPPLRSWPAASNVA